jgi:ribosomal protein S13
MPELTKKQIEIALKDINSVGQNVYNIYCFTNNCDNKTEIDGMTAYLNTVPDSVKVIKQLLEDNLNELS